MLVSKGIGKRGVEVIAVEMLVFMRGFAFWSNFVKYSGLTGNIYLVGYTNMSEVIGLWIPFYVWLV